MRRNLVRTIGTLLLLGLVMSAGMLLAETTNQPPAVTSNSANWYDVEQASRMLNRMQTLSLKVRKEVARIQVQDWQLYWSDQADRLSQAKADINEIGVDLAKLDQMKSRIEPWQQNLLEKVTPQVHEMVYSMDVALKTIKAHHDRYRLMLSEYPQNINIIYKNANQMAGTIGTVTQYAHAEERMAELHHQMTTNKANS